MNIGAEFENDLAEEFGLKKTPGSGNQWHSKLDISGQGARWSLKATSKKTLSISERTIDEAINACEGLGGTGEIPVWAFRINGRDIIALRKEDFKLLSAGELNIIKQEPKEKVADRRARASVPSLFRDED